MPRTSEATKAARYLASRSHKVVKERYGTEFYRTMVRKRKKNPVKDPVDNPA